MTETTLRPATPADLPVIFRAERDYIVVLEPDQEAAWTAAIDRHLDLWITNLGRTTMLLAGPEVAGYLIWAPALADPGDAAVLVTIAVLAACRRRGYGRVLLDVFARQAAAAGYRRLRLGVHRDNPARALYERAGYQPAGRDGDYLLYELAAPRPSRAVDAGPTGRWPGAGGPGSGPGPRPARRPAGTGRKPR